MSLPIAISIPHAGLLVPAEAAPYCQLTPRQIREDGDEGAAECYDLRDEVNEFLTTEVARAIVDLNRPPDDRRVDGVVKTRTIWNEPIYREPLPEEVVRILLENYYHPYHARLTSLAQQDLLFAVDCHTMVASGPSIGPDPGKQRPEVCLGNVHGRSLSPEWTEVVRECFERAFEGFRVTLNEPFSGGYITKEHGGEMPWFQVELSRASFLPRPEIRERVRDALRAGVERLGK